MGLPPKTSFLHIAEIHQLVLFPTTCPIIVGVIFVRHLTQLHLYDQRAAAE